MLRCNQCTNAPCVTICPVTALHKRDDGIVDLDKDVCIGCKACMQACPYDALYLNTDTGGAEKCHFCAHRVEQNLEPACVTVCPERAIIPGEQTEWNYWSGKLSFGATIRRGNVDQTDVSASARIQRRDPGSRLQITYNGAYSTVEGDKTADNHRGVINYDLFLTRRFYFRPASLTAYRDVFQNIDLRLTPAIGAGYELINRDGITWEVGGGVGWEFTTFADPLPDGQDTEDSAALLFNTSLDWEATPKIDVLFDFNITIPMPERSEYNFHAALTVEMELWGDLDLDVSVIWDRVNEPEQLSDGTTPDQNDLRLFVGLGWEF